MLQQTLPFLDVDPLQENWDASLQAAIALLVGALRTFKLSITVQGSHTTPSRVRIQLQDSKGVDIPNVVVVRCRVVNNNGYANATNATIAVFTGTVVETLTANKDLVIESSGLGIIELTCTDATIETFNVLIGPPPVAAPFANFNNGQVVVHA